MNIYFLISGILLVLLAILHAFYGEINIFGQLANSNLTQEIKTSLYIPWHQLSFILFVSGISLLIAAFKKEIKNIAVFIFTIIAGNLLVFFIITVARRDWKIIETSIPQYILFGALLVLIFLGIRKAGRTN